MAAVALQCLLLLSLFLLLALSHPSSIAEASRETAFIGYSEERSIRIVPSSSSFSSIRIVLEPRVIPSTNVLIMDAMRTGVLSGSWYRNEAVPGVDEGSGPPYGLLQGKMNGISFPKEENNVRIVIFELPCVWDCVPRVLLR